MDPVYEYDEVHSVSDLHFGGTPGFQVFKLGSTLAKLIDHLRRKPKGRRVALVINGDFVDFLAEQPSMHFDPDGAVRKLERIFADSAFRPVWLALRRFTRTPDRFLIITLGNHDLELALPWVSERLLRELSGDRLSARGRILLSFDGSGFLCSVGGRKVLFVHGNEVDTWNLCDYEHLRRVGRDLTQGNRVKTWEPNAGSKMVIEVMNGIKREYPFIDLLKPENEGAVPVLLALDPKQARKIPSVLRVVARRTWDAGRRVAGFLSAGEGEEAADGEVEMQRILARSFSLQGEEVDVDEMLDRVEERMADGESAYSALDRDRDGEYLSVPGAIWKALRGAKKSEVVREAFEKLKQDESFALNYQDATFKDLDARIGPEIDYLVTGHTHLERRLTRRNGGGTYFNSGTWIRLMRLTEDILNDAVEFERIFDLLGTSTMEDLDNFTYRAAGIARPLVILKPAVVSIFEQAGTVRADLLRVDLDTGLPGPREED